MAAGSEPAAPTVSIIVVSYNTREMTLEAIRSAIAETRTPHEIIVIDNDSKDGSAEAIRAAFPDIRLMAETHNHGFGRANNIASKFASGRYLLLLNPDTIVLDGAVDRVVAFADAHPEARIWGGRTLFGDRSLNPTNCWGRMTLWSLFCRAVGLTGVFPHSPVFNTEALGGWPRDTVREVDIVTGCFFLIEREFWEELDGFDETFVMYGDEADLCLRAIQVGARPMITPEAEIVHYVGMSSVSHAEKMILLLRARISLVKRHFPGWRRGVGLALLKLWALTRAAVARLKGRGGMWPDVWRRRKEWQDGWADRPRRSGS